MHRINRITTTVTRCAERGVRYSTPLLAGVIAATTAIPAGAQDDVINNDTVTVPSGSHPSPFEYTGSLTIGETGSGSVFVNAGGELITATSVWLGYEPSGSGSITVSGTDAVWTRGGGVHVGYEGNGQLTISNGGQVTRVPGASGGFTLGHRGNATVTVTGEGSRLDVDTGTGVADMSVGRTDGGVGELTVSDGAVVRTGSGFIAWGSGSTGTVTLTGEGSNWHIVGSSNYISVGRHGTGEMTLSDGATVTGSSGAGTFVGSGSDAVGTLTITDEGTSWQTSGFSVGGGNSAHVTITDGAEVITTGSSGSAAIGGPGDIDDTTVTVTGEGTKWQTTNLLFIADNGDSGKLTVEEGALLQASGVRIGWSSGGSDDGDATIMLTGEGTSWDADTSTIMFGGGTGDYALTVAQGAQVSGHTIRSTSAGFVINIGAAQGDTPVAPGTLAFESLRLGDEDDRILVFNHTADDYVFQTPIGSQFDDGGLIRHLAGVTTLTGDNAEYDGQTSVLGGELYVQDGLHGAIDIEDGATFGGSGLVGSVHVKDGATLSPGNSIGTLTVAQDLTLDADATLQYSLGEPGFTADPAAGVSDRIDVAGDLTLDGQLLLSESDDAGDGTVGIGYYRLMTYGGNLTDNTLEVANASDWDLLVGGGNVDLYLQSSLVDPTIQHWAGGDGTWSQAGEDWLDDGETDPTVWAGQHAVFKDIDPHEGGTITLDGEQTFQGLQFVDNGYTLEGAGSLLIDGSADPAGNAEIRVLADSAEIASQITGTGGITKTQAGTLVLSTQNTYQGGTILAAGTLRLEHDQALGTGPLTIQNSTVDYDQGITLANAIELENDAALRVQTGNATHTGDISGSAGIEKRGDGTLTLSGSNTYMGPTHVIDGTLEASGGDAVGEDSAVTVDQEATFALTDNNQTIGSLAGEGTVNLDAFTLTTTDDDPAAFAGQLIGTAGSEFINAGSGTLAFTGDNSAFQGLTRVDAGQLSVSGDLGGTVTVSDGGTLRGTGVVGTTTVNQGGTVAPGNSIGTLTVDGDLTLSTGGTLAITVNAEPQNSSLLFVQGDASLAQDSEIAVTQSDTASLEDGHVFNAIEAEQSINDAGAQVNSQIVGVDMTGDIVEVGGNHVYQLTVSLDAQAFKSKASGAINKQIAGALDSLPMDAQLRTMLQGLDDEQTNEAMNQLSPLARQVGSQVNVQQAQSYNAEISTHLAGQLRGGPSALARATNTNQFAGALADAADDPRLLAAALDARTQADAHAMPSPVHDRPWGAFAQVGGVFQNQEHESDRTGFRSDSIVAQTGVDYRIDQNWMIGLGGGFTYTSTDFKAGRGEMDTHSYRIGPYAGYARGPWFFSGALKYGFHRFETDRDIPITGETATSKHEGHDVTVAISGEYDYEIDQWTLTPLAGAQYVYLHETGHVESGAAGALEIGHRDTHSLRTRVGGRADYELQTASMTFVPEVSAGWERESLADRNEVDARFVAGGEGFTIEPGTPDRNRAFFGAGATALLNEQTSVYLQYSGLASSRGESHAVIGGISLRF